MWQPPPVIGYQMIENKKSMQSNSIYFGKTLESRLISILLCETYIYD